MKLSLPDQLTILGERFTQKQLAKKFGVSDRTIRRWKNERVSPSVAKGQAITQISKAARSVRRSLLEQGRARAQSFRIPASIPVPPSKVRRISRIDPRDPSRKRRIPSDTIDADVSKLRNFDIYSLLVAYRDKANAERRRAGFRLLVKMDSNFESGGMVRPAGSKTMTRWEEFNDWSDEEIAEYLNELEEAGKVYRVRLLDPIQPKAAKRGAKKQARKPKRSRK